MEGKTVKKYKINIVLHLKPQNEEDDIILGSIYISQHDSYAKILKEINTVLLKNYLVQVIDFHYQTEDNDIDYVSKDNFNQTALMENLKEINRFYIYWNEEA